MAVVNQISYLPSHKVAVNCGFQVNYGLPSTLSGFYNPIFWARSGGNKTSLMGEFFNKLIEEPIDEDDEIEEEEEATEKPPRIVKRDLTAGEIYQSIRDVVAFSGYHQDCLLKSVCELAKHPLAAEDEENLISELLHFVLTPSLHNGFDDEKELEEKRAFESAENLGKIGGDCDLEFENCQKSPLEFISNFITLRSEY